MSDHDFKVLLDAQAICDRIAVKDGIIQCSSALDAAGELRRVIAYYDPAQKPEPQDVVMPF